MFITMNSIETATMVLGNEHHELRPLPVLSPAATVSRRSSMQASAPEIQNYRHSGNGQQLAPVDGGIAAWRLLGAAFVFETLLWGKSLCYPKKLMLTCNRVSVVLWCFPGLLLKNPSLC
jgi:hypothetical protein